MGNRFLSGAAILGFGFVGALALPSARACAQVGLNPVVIQSEVSSGQAQSVITVTNPGNEPMRVRVYAEPFTYERVNGFVLLDEDSNDLTPYLQFSPQEFVIPPDESQQVRVVGWLPPSLDESEYRAVIFTESLSEGASESSAAAAIQTRIGSTVYFRQPNSEPAFSIVQAQWNEEEDQAQLLVSNAGAATARPNANWSIQRDGETVAAGQSGATTVMEGGDRLISLPYFNEAQAALPPGDYRVVGELIWYFGKQQSSQSFSAPLSVR